MPPSTPHFFSADRPIERLADDRLQRRSFAESIAQAITQWGEMASNPDIQHLMSGVALDGIDCDPVRF